MSDINAGIYEALKLIQRGENYHSYKVMGAHKKAEGGYVFRVWAPEAQYVSVIGEFNGWDAGASPMTKDELYGVWSADLDYVKEGELYKYFIKTSDGRELYKADPYGFSAELRPGTASKTAVVDKYKWKDSKWIKAREKKDIYSSPVNIYELHLGSWKKNGEEFLNYREIAEELSAYVKKMGYTHVELMPVQEHPFDGSWGYQVTGYYAPSSRYGFPEDFMYFVDTMHKNDIGVIMDWVPAHFPRDAHGLYEFDGSCLYEYADTRIGEHKEWGTKVFNYRRNEVISFLISNAVYWFDMYHIDGLRVDAVSSMLYRNYGRNDGEWVANEYGGIENLEAIELLKKLNKTVFGEFGNVMMIAEESTAWPLVTAPIDDGGLGFNFKWNMGWMNDVLQYIALDPIYRSANHDKLTFSMMYAFSENYILPISHDEVVHGKRSLLNKMWGYNEEKFASARAFFGYMMSHPGKKLTFMTNEIGEFLEWDEKKEVYWDLLKEDLHGKFNKYLSDLNGLYAEAAPLHEIETSWDGFEWINADDRDFGILSFIRKSKKQELISVVNFQPMHRENYWVGVNKPGKYKIVFSSDDKKYGGEGLIKRKTITTHKGECNGRNYYLKLNIPAYAFMYIECIEEAEDTDKNNKTKKTKVK